MKSSSGKLAIVAAGALLACDPNSSPNWDVRERAKSSQSHPLAGFWKANACSTDVDWGLAIGPMTESSYYVSFCGPRGCFAEGTYRPETKLYGDPAYEVVSTNEIGVKGKDGLTKYVRCPEEAAQQRDAADEAQGGTRTAN